MTSRKAATSSITANECQRAVEAMRFRFQKEKGRMMWVPDRVDLVEVSTDPLRHGIVAGAGAKEITDLITTLDELQVPRSAGRGKARKALSEAGHKISNVSLTEALAERKRQPGQIPDRTDEPPQDRGLGQVSSAV